jgi:hypothetical protein
MPAQRRCECGCGEPLTGLRPNARFATDACRTRTWKAKHRYADPRRSKPSRNGTSRRKPTLRISYLKAVAAVGQELASLGHPAPHRRARALLRPLLTPAARRWAP